MKKYKYILLVIFSIFAICFTYNNYFLYKTPILKITKIEVEKSDEVIIQNITGIIKNGEYKGKSFNLKNNTSFSGVYDEQIHKNSELFVRIKDENISLLNIKRDKYIVILLVLFIDLIIIVGKKKGILTLLSLFLNVILSLLAIFVYHRNLNINILLLFMPVSLFFTISSLFITNGKSKKTLSAIISAITSLFISFLLSFILIEIYGKSVPYFAMDYIELIRDYKNLFYVNVLLSGLGAIMDISITMSSSINELIEKNNNIKRKDLIMSGKEISKDIIGTMCNVMLYTCFTSIIPISILAFKNGLTISSIINQFGQIEMIRVLTGSISIVLTVPISLYISILILKGGK